MKILMGMGTVAIALSVAALSADAKQLKVLMIGNSFSESVMAELPKAAAAYPGCELDIVNMMIGGCSLERHWANVEKAATDPEFRPYFIDRRYASDKEKGKSLPRNANIPEMLVADRWDIVTIQQASPKSPFYETYQPYADKLIAKIRELAPQAEIRIQQTWSYTPYSGRLREWKMTPETMHVAVTNAYGQLAEKYGFKVIPTGDAVALYRAKLPVRYEKVLTKAEIAAIVQPGTLDFHGDPVGSSAWKKGRKTEKDADEIKLRSDAIHLNAEGKYLQACVWLAALFDVDVTKLVYEPALKDFSSRAKLMRECAAEAVAGARGPSALSAEVKSTDYPARNFCLGNVVVDEVFENFVRVENVDGIKLDVMAKKVQPDVRW